MDAKIKVTSRIIKNIINETRKRVGKEKKWNIKKLNPTFVTLEKLMMIILFPKTHNPYFPFLCSSLEVYSYLYFLSCKVYFQIHVQMFVVSLLALPISCLCLMPLTGSFSGIPWPLHLRPHHKGQQRVSRNGRWQDLPSFQLERSQGPTGCHSKHAGEGKKMLCPWVNLLCLCHYSPAVCIWKMLPLQVWAREQEKHPTYFCKKFSIFDFHLPCLSNSNLFIHIWEWSN